IAIRFRSSAFLPAPAALVSLLPALPNRPSAAACASCCLLFKPLGVSISRRFLVLGGAVMLRSGAPCRGLITRILSILRALLGILALLRAPSKRADIE